MSSSRGIWKEMGPSERVRVSERGDTVKVLWDGEIASPFMNASKGWSGDRLRPSTEISKDTSEAI